MYYYRQSRDGEIIQYVQEASADTIEVHEDDPETFQNMMQFFYNMELKKPPRVENVDKFFKSDVIPLVALHAVADKYDAKSLQEAALIAFKSHTDELGYIPSFETLTILIHAYYSVYLGVMGDMGQAIVKHIFRTYTYPLKTGKYDALVVQYGNFGADLFLVGRATSKLMMK